MPPMFLVSVCPSHGWRRCCYMLDGVGKASTKVDELYVRCARISISTRVYLFQPEPSWLRISLTVCGLRGLHARLLVSGYCRDTNSISPKSRAGANKASNCQEGEEFTFPTRNRAVSQTMHQRFGGATAIEHITGTMSSCAREERPKKRVPMVVVPICLRPVWNSAEVPPANTNNKKGREKAPAQRDDLSSRVVDEGG